MLDLQTALDRRPLFAVIRGCPTAHLEAVVTAGVEAGFSVIEITLDSPDAVANIASLTSEATEACVGAGTALSAADVQRAHEAGAGFVVSPVLDREVLEAARRLGVVCIPGAATPSEVRLGVQLGATMVKVFPAAQLGGPAFVRAIKSVLGDIALVPTGGIDAGNVADYLNAGARAVGVGSAVFSRSLMEAGDIGTIADGARALVEATP